MSDGEAERVGSFVIRPYRDGDEDALREVCIRTGRSGRDASDWIPGNLLPDVYLSPYLRYAPELASVVVNGRGRPCGYLVAVAGTGDFVRWYRSDWLPSFERIYPLPDAVVTPSDSLAVTGRHPERFLGPDQSDYPGHLHIDLLPEAQGRGLGRRLMRRALRLLRDRGVPGVQLGVGARNLRARGFYAHLGFRPLPDDPDNPLELGIGTDEEI